MPPGELCGLRRGVLACCLLAGAEIRASGCRRRDGAGSSYWEAARLLTVYTLQASYPRLTAGWRRMHSRHLVGVEVSIE
jgi:hypothetical protein